MATLSWPWKWRRLKTTLFLTFAYPAGYGKKHFWTSNDWLIDRSESLHQMFGTLKSKPPERYWKLTKISKIMYKTLYMLHFVNPSVQRTAFPVDSSPGSAPLELFELSLCTSVNVALVGAEWRWSLLVHQGKSRWHSCHVLVYISPNLPFRDCAMYCDHGVYRRYIIKQNGMPNWYWLIWLSQNKKIWREIEPSSWKLAKHLPRVASSKTAFQKIWT